MPYIHLQVFILNIGCIVMLVFAVSTESVLFAKRLRPMTYTHKLLLWKSIIVGRSKFIFRISCSRTNIYAPVQSPWIFYSLFEEYIMQYDYMNKKPYTEYHIKINFKFLAFTFCIIKTFAIVSDLVYTVAYFFFFFVEA